MALQEELEAQGNFLFRYRGVLPLIVLAAGIGVFVLSISELDENSGSFWLHTYDFVCFAVSFLGLAVRAYTVGYTPRNTSGRNTQKQLADRLNTQGVYSLVRHPLYVGNFLMWLGLAMLTQNLWFVVSFIMLYWIYYEKIMFAEEQFLRKKFGEQYLKWSEHTPAFIPNFSANWKKPQRRFSWKKVLKNEKSGFVNLFLLFFVFQLIEEFVRDLQWFTESKIWGFALIFSMVAYLIIKFLTKKTSVLDENKTT